MPISLTKPVQTFTVLHLRGEVRHVVPARAELQPDGAYDDAWRDVFALGLHATEVQAVDRSSAVRAAATEIGPYVSERDWRRGRIDEYLSRNRWGNPSMPVQDRTVVIDVLAESDYEPHVDPTGPAIVWGAVTPEGRRDWFARQPTGLLLRWYAHVRGIRRPETTPWG
ncbi:hypothetical protein ACIQCR_16805 [Streptomyces sp. NPDC093249]|uniref:hypothetical protein n=1 Tax=unclassified Streptomyces TaxID=2593676 RepID=UPI0034505B49